MLIDEFEYKEASIELAKKLNIPFIEETQNADNDYLYLKYDEYGLSLVKDKMILRADFLKLVDRIKPNKLNGELLVKAAQIRKFEFTPVIIDATAGFCEDSFLLAAAGAKIIAFEKDTVIAALLEDGLKRAKQIQEISDIADRIEIHVEDSIAAMESMDEKIDIVYLDPMFPQRDKSGLIKKKFQLLQKLESPCKEQEALINAAFKTKASKIIVKRPLKGENLAGVKPSYSLKGRAIRYDCYTR